MKSKTIIIIAILAFLGWRWYKGRQVPATGGTNTGSTDPRANGPVQADPDLITFSNPFDQPATATTVPTVAAPSTFGPDKFQAYVDAQDPTKSDVFSGLPQYENESLSLASPAFSL